MRSKILSLAALLALGSASSGLQAAEPVPPCVEVSGRLLNTGQRVLLGPYLSQQRVDAADGTGFGPITAYDSSYVQSLDRPREWLHYRFCLHNALPFEQNLVLTLEGRHLEGLHVSSIVEGESVARVHPSGELPAGLNQTAVRLTLPAERRVHVIIRLRGRVGASLSALRQHYYDNEVSFGPIRRATTVFLSATTMVFIIALGLALLFFSRVYLYLSVFILTVTAWMLHYTGSLTGLLAHLSWANDEPVSVCLATIALLTVSPLSAQLLKYGPLSHAHLRHFALATRIVGVLAAVATLDMLLSLELGWWHPLPGYYRWRDVVPDLAFFTLAILLPAPVWHSVRSGYRPARYLVAAYVVFVAFVSFVVLFTFGVITDRVLVLYAVFVGCLFEFICLSLALAMRFLEHQRAQVERLRHSEHQLQLQNEQLESKVSERTAELQALAEQLSEQNTSLQIVNHDMVASLEYAERIQRALLPTSASLHRSFVDHFIFYQPRDIVSGDFYWYARSEGKLYLGAVDCTGHGVPGAFMSVMAYNLLNQTIKDRPGCSPEAFLEHLDHALGVALQLRKDGEAGTQTNDGMDIALVVYDPAANTIAFAGAMRPLYYVRGGELHEVRGARFPIGGTQYGDKVWEGHVLSIEPGDQYYITSDGLVDQFGGPNGRKFTPAKLKKLLVELKDAPLQTQADSVKQAVDQWMQGYEQLDDLMLVGIRPR